jgi:alcohol dehydrogenase class IV
MRSCGILHENFFIGEGSLSHLDSITEKENYQDILLITDPVGFRLNGADEYFKRLGARPYINRIREVSYEGKALPLEDLETLYAGLRDESKVDAIIAVGGGTVIDTAKVLSIAISNRCERVAEVLDDRQLQNRLPLVFIPTTAGTGSEATSFAVVYRDRVKISIDNQSLLPSYVILEPLLLRTLPERVLHSTVLDALAQATESIWAVGSTDESHGYSRRAVLLILENIHAQPSILRLSNLQLGSYWAGRAINISKTTLSHSISYPITAHFGIPHGIAVFLTLPEVAEMNFHTTEATKQDTIELEKVRDAFSLIFSLYGAADVVGLKERLKEVMVWLKIKSRLRDYGIARSDLSFIASRALTKGRSDNNPRRFTESEILNLLNRIF